MSCWKSDLAPPRQTDADAIAVFMHWGQEYATSPPPSSASWRIFCSRTARRLCSAAMSMCRSRWSCASCPTDAPAFCATVRQSDLQPARPLHQSHRRGQPRADEGRRDRRGHGLRCRICADVYAASGTPRRRTVPPARSEPEHRRLRERRSYGRTAAVLPALRRVLRTRTAFSAARRNYNIPAEKAHNTKKELTFTGQLSFFRFIRYCDQKRGTLEVADLLRADVPFPCRHPPSSRRTRSS